MAIIYYTFKVTIYGKEQSICELDVNSSTTVLELKEAIMKAVHIVGFRLNFQKQLLDDHKRLTSYGIYEGCLLDLRFNNETDSDPYSDSDSY